MTADAARGSALALNGSTGYAATSGPVLDTSRSYTVSTWTDLSSQSGTSARRTRWRRRVRGGAGP
ncbi:hypothetical protein ACFY0B_33385 [Streptomyces sp. NPDC001797]|uniref:hypothetical protein n=1 Tax=Streptomyces sp. NPDC001797 TaxID=3364610 RepID=UPI003693E277